MRISDTWSFPVFRAIFQREVFGDSFPDICFWKTKIMRKQGTIFRRVVTKKIAVAKWQFNAFGAVFLAFGTMLGAYVILSGSIPKIFAWDLSDAWSFSSTGDYTASSGVTVDTTNTEVRLSVKNYTSDADTAALYHFDESSGGTANDSSSSANHATVTNGSFSTGSLNNGLTMNGATTYVTASDVAAHVDHRGYDLRVMGEVRCRIHG
jgi:hypothetical protein